MSEPADKTQIGRTVSRAILLLIGLIVAGLALNALPRGPEGLDTGLLERLIVGQGATGQAIFVLAAAGFCAVGLPRQIASFAAGYAFGLWLGIALVLVALVIACAADFLWARTIARDWTRRHIMHRFGGRLSRWDAFFAANPFSTTLTARMLPVGSNLVLNLLAGVSAIRAAPFLAASALGYLPQTIIFALLGSGIGVANWLRVGLAGVLFAVSILLGFILLRRHKEAAAISGSA